MSGAGARPGARGARRYAVPGLLLACALPSAHADDEIAALRGQLQQIEALTRDFAARLRALETLQAAAAGAAPGSAGGTALAAAPPVVARPAAAPLAAAAPVATPVLAPSPALPATPVPAAALTFGAVPRQAWRQVREGLSAEQVTALLGAPTRVFELSGRTVWYYSYPAAGAGSVFFTSAGRISSVQRP